MPIVFLIRLPFFRKHRALCCWFSLLLPLLPIPILQDFLNRSDDAPPSPSPSPTPHPPKGHPSLEVNSPSISRESREVSCSRLEVAWRALGELWAAGWIGKAAGLLQPPAPYPATQCLGMGRPMHNRIVVHVVPCRGRPREVMADDAYSDPSTQLSGPRSAAPPHPAVAFAAAAAAADQQLMIFCPLEDVLATMPSRGGETLASSRCLLLPCLGRRLLRTVLSRWHHRMRGLASASCSAIVSSRKALESETAFVWARRRASV